MSSSSSSRRTDRSGHHPHRHHTSSHANNSSSNGHSSSSGNLPAILTQLLAMPANRTCADCGNKDPRWASWNLGIFVCIECSGIHRSIGTHISRVKSTNLDVWTAEQVENMLRWGNERANAYWQATLPANYTPSRSGGMANFIRAKYERKEFVVRGQPMPVYEPMDLSDLHAAATASSSATGTAATSSSPAPRSFSPTTTTSSSSSVMKSASSERISQLSDKDSATKLANRKKLEQIRSHHRSHSEPPHESAATATNHSSKASNAEAEEQPKYLPEPRDSANLIDLDMRSSSSPSSLPLSSSSVPSEPPKSNGTDLDALSALFSGSHPTAAAAPAAAPASSSGSGNGASAFAFLRPTTTSSSSSSSPASSAPSSSGDLLSSGEDLLSGSMSSASISSMTVEPSTSVPDLLVIEPRATKESILALYGKGSTTTPTSSNPSMPLPAGFSGMAGSPSGYKPAYPTTYYYSPQASYSAK